ncbi:MAG: nucleoside deaminase [Gammaproteobacteria bacterium]|nr:MAG: nucleoside deaminase [Gammaproteobacteria bacterium]
MKHWKDIVLPIPEWLNRWAAGIPQIFPDANQRMTMVIDLARINVQHGGGPFAAAVFAQHTGELIAPGVNWVVPGKSSLLHAEVMALALAEQTLGSYELASRGSFELVTSAEPCCQCLGVLQWTGIAAVVCGARSEDVQATGFNEGQRPPNWVEELQRRGISVTREVMRSQAIEILQSYSGEIYNSRLLL